MQAGFWPAGRIVMASNGIEQRSGRETRLLVLVVGVAVAVLLLLARWRYPASNLSVVTPSAAPLASLAARATFDEMVGTMTDVLTRVSPVTVVIPFESSRPEPGTRRAGRAGAETPGPSTTPVLGVRVRRAVAIAYAEQGMTPRTGEGLPFEVISHDASRNVMLIRVAEAPAEPDTFSASVRTFPGISYMAAVDATTAGPAIQPVFIGRPDTVMDPRWSHPLVPASNIQGLTPGVFVFALNGRLAGLVVETEAGPMVVPAPALETLVQALEAGSPAR
jgi:hypothetical protein